MEWVTLPEAWIAPQPVSVHLVWHLYNNVGRLEYAMNKRRGAFEWQQWPATDLPDYVPADEVPTALAG